MLFISAKPKQLVSGGDTLVLFLNLAKSSQNTSSNLGIVLSRCGEVWNECLLVIAMVGEILTLASFNDAPSLIIPRIISR